MGPHLDSHPRLRDGREIRCELFPCSREAPYGDDRYVNVQEAILASLISQIEPDAVPISVDASSRLSLRLSRPILLPGLGQLCQEIPQPPGQTLRDRLALLPPWLM